MNHRRRAISLLLCAILGACALAPPGVTGAGAGITALLPADAILIGEQHDSPEHQQIHLEAVQALATRGRLAALAIEMSTRGTGTAGLARDADEAAVKAALRWQDEVWPWKAYGPAIMAAVRAGVPVLGANLPRDRMRAAMGDASLDARLSGAALQTQRQGIRDGHCNLLPDSQITPMTRIQIARDVEMAGTIVQARRGGQTVLLIAGGGHVARGLGVPVHLPDDLQARVVLARAGQAADAKPPGSGPGDAPDLVIRTPPLPPTDYCASLRK